MAHEHESDPKGMEGSAPSAQESAENVRVNVTGRLGGDPQFRTLPEKNTLVASFSVAQHPEPDTTVWHNVVVFGERAEQVQQRFESGELKKGVEVEVVGYVHHRERPTKDGGTRIVEEIYAAAVKPVVKPAQGPQEGQGPQASPQPPEGPSRR